MTESTNYKFKLPSSAAGVNDEADIDVISENFSKIDGLLKSTTDKSDTSVQYTEITGTNIILPIENGIYLVKNDSTVSGTNVSISANSVFCYNGGYQVDGSTYVALLTMLKGVVSSSGDTFQNIIVSGSNSTGSLVLSYKVDNFAENATVQSALLKKQDNLVSGTNIKTINGNSILGSGNLETSEITVDDVLSDTSTNPVQNKVVKAALDSKLEVKVLDYTNTNLITREQLVSLEPGIYDIKYDKNNSEAPYFGYGVNVQINTSFDPITSTFTTSTIGFAGNDGVARVNVDYIFIGDYVQIGKRVTAEGILGQNPGDTIGTFVDLFLNSGMGLVDKINDYALTSDLTRYKKADDVNDGIASTSPTVQLVYQSYSSTYQYSNVLTSLTITVPTTPINLDQSIRLIFKATSSTTITVPSGLYFRGDDCNDSYVFIPQDNKVYDIIITYDGFNYNGIVVGTPATR